MRAHCWGRKSIVRHLAFHAPVAGGSASIPCDQSLIARLHNLSTFGIIVPVQLLSLRGDAHLAGSLLSAPVAVSACKVVTSDPGLCNLVRFGWCRVSPPASVEVLQHD